MKRYTRYVAAGVAAAALAAGLASCGGSSSKSESTSTSSASATAAWADNFCGAFLTWRTTVKASVPKSGSLTTDTLKQSASAIADANDELASEIDDLGKPPTPGAEKAKAAAQQLSDELRSAGKKITDATSSIAGPSDVLPAVSTITASLTAMGDDLKT